MHQKRRPAWSVRLHPHDIRALFRNRLGPCDDVMRECDMLSSYASHRAQRGGGGGGGDKEPEELVTHTHGHATSPFAAPTRRAHIE